MKNMQEPLASESVSENSADGGNSDGAQSETGLPENSGSDTQTGGGDTPDSPETSSGSASDLVSGPAVPEVGSSADEQVSEMAHSLDGVRESLVQLEDRLGDSEIYAPLLDSINTLAGIMTVQAENASTIPIPGYLDWDYPVSVVWEVYPSAPGAPSKQESKTGHATPEDFETEYNRLSSLVGQTLNGFRVLRVSDCSDEEYVYDADNVTEDPAPVEPEPEEPDTYRDDVLSALASIRGDLQAISANDLDAYNGMRETLADMQEENTAMQYHFLASNVAIAVSVMLLFGYTVIHGFFERMKAG